MAEHPTDPMQELKAMAPPVAPGQTRNLDTQSDWPKVLGTISIVFGCLGMLGGILRLFNSVTMEFLSQKVPMAAQAAVDLPESLVLWNTISGAIGFVMAALLLVGGIRLIRRRAAFVGIITVWAVSKMVFVLADAAFQVGFQGAVIEQATAAQGTPLPGGDAVMTLIAVVTVVVTLLWGWALPLFFLIWMRRAKIKAEMQNWA